MSQSIKKPYNLEDRTLEFAKRIVRLSKALSKNTINFKLVDQLIRSGGSVGANYREANEALSKKDFIDRMKISRKECKETTYWLEIVKEANKTLESEINICIQESKELRNIFTAVITKSS